MRTQRRRYGWRAGRSVRSASVVKAMLMVAYLRRTSVRARPLHRGDLRLLAPMVRWSNNRAGTRVHTLVGGGALARLARRARMACFRPAPFWGNSSICAADQARFFLHIERHVPRRHRRVALRLLASVVRPQRWGIARAAPRGWDLYFKGGWGDGRGAVDHQVALLRRDRRRLAVAIMTTGNPSHAYGKESLRGIAARLFRGLQADSEPR